MTLVLGGQKKKKKVGEREREKSRKERKVAFEDLILIYYLVFLSFHEIGCEILSESDPFLFFLILRGSCKLEIVTLWRDTYRFAP